MNNIFHAIDQWSFEATSNHKTCFSFTLKCLQDFNFNFKIFITQRLCVCIVRLFWKVWSIFHVVLLYLDTLLKKASHQRCSYLIKTFYIYLLNMRLLPGLDFSQVFMPMPILPAQQQLCMYFWLKQHTYRLEWNYILYMGDQNTLAKVLLPLFVLYLFIVSTTFIHERLERIERRTLVMVTYIYKVRFSKWSKCPWIMPAK